MASAAWLQASGDHFIVYSSTGEKQLRDFTTQLERFDRGLRRLYLLNTPEDTGSRSNRLKIFVVTNAAGVRDLCGRAPWCKDVAGFYTPHTAGSVVFTPRRSGDGSSNDMSAQIILFHEYAHHFMYTAAAAAYPSWFTEGFAEFASTARLEKDGGFSFGLPAFHRANSLNYGMSLSMEKLLASDSQRVQNSEALYSRGWLLTHYLFFTGQRTGQLKKYIEDINRGTPGLEAGKAAFGDLKMLDRELDQYFLKRKMSYISLPADQLPIGQIEIHPLSAGAAEMMPVHMRSVRGVSKEQALELVIQARRLAAPFPTDADVQAQLAEAEFDAGNLAEAEAAADRAIAADARNMSGLLYKGQILMARARTDRSADSKTWAKARNWFVKANKLDPDAAMPLFLFFESFSIAREPPTENAVAGLLRAFELRPDDPGLRMHVAYHALATDHPKGARVALAPIAFSPHASGMRDRAAKVIGLIDAGNRTEALAALSAPPQEEKSD